MSRESNANDGKGLFLGMGVEVGVRHDKFSLVIETLTRMGIADHESRTLEQLCHILHKRGRYRIMHHKELVWFNAGESFELEREDRLSRDRVVSLLSTWGLISIIDDSFQHPRINASVEVVRHAEKNDWTLVAKCQVGRKRVADDR